VGILLWPFKALWWLISSPFWLIYGPFWLICKAVQLMWAGIQWPFTRGGAAELERQIDKAGIERATQIEYARRGIPMPGASGRLRPQKQVYRRKR